MWIWIVPHHEHTSKAIRYGTNSPGISKFHLHTPCSSANGMNHIYLFLPSQSWSSFTDPVGIEGWVGLGGWLHTEINVWQRELNLDMVTHLSANRAQRRLTSLIKISWRATTIPDCHCHMYKHCSSTVTQMAEHRSTLNWKKPSNSSRNSFGKITKKGLVMTLRNTELLSSSVSFSFTSRHFPAFLKCYKMGKNLVSTNLH